MSPTTNTIATHETISAWFWITNSWLKIGGFFLSFLLPGFLNVADMAFDLFYYFGDFWDFLFSLKVYFVGSLRIFLQDPTTCGSITFQLITFNWKKSKKFLCYILFKCFKLHFRSQWIPQLGYTVRKFREIYQNYLESAQKIYFSIHRDNFLVDFSRLE